MSLLSILVEYAEFLHLECKPDTSSPKGKLWIMKEVQRLILSLYKTILRVIKNGLMLFHNSMVNLVSFSFPLKKFK